MPSETVSRLVTRLGEAVKQDCTSLATAESCTGGQLSAAIVADPKVSGALERGFVVYSLDAKCELLDLERDRVEQCQGVSEDIARAMAVAALHRSHADLAVAITGFAGPREGEEEVGLVHVATAGGKGARHRELHLGDVGREAVCERAVIVALEMLIEQATA